MAFTMLKRPLDIEKRERDDNLAVPDDEIKQTIQTLEQTITPRDYQLQLAEFAQKNNCIVYLPTGTGKTFIAVLLLRHYLTHIQGSLKNSQRAIFLTPTTSLANQQCSYLRAHLPVKVDYFIGSHGVDTWSEAYWHSQMEHSSVLVMTPKIFLSIISVKILPLEKVACVIFDEAHWCSTKMSFTGEYTPKNTEYNQILEYIQKSDHKPRLLGLTASLINQVCSVTDIKKHMAFLELQFQGKCVGASESNLYSPNLKLICYEFDSSSSSFTDLKYFLACMVDTFKHNFSKSGGMGAFLLEENDELEELEACDPEKMMLMCLRQMGTYFSFVQYSLEYLGVWCAWDLIHLLKEDIRRSLEMPTTSVEYKALMMEVQKVFTMLIGVFTRIMLPYKSKLNQLLSLSSPQLLRLLDVIKRQKDSMGDEFRCLIFVQRRIVSSLLARFLKELAAVEGSEFKFLRVDYVLGKNATDHFFRQSIFNQTQVLQSFRRNTCVNLNTLVSTSVLEEGIDVPQCNLVIRFDKLRTFREWVQSKGRARFGNSKYIMLHPNRGFKKYLEQLSEFRRIESYLEQRKFEKEASVEIQKALQDAEESIVSKTGITITCKQAFFFVNRYCDKALNARNYPKFKIFRNGEEYQARVYLPNKSLLPEPINGKVAISQRDAKNSAMLETLKKLYEINELKDNFLPKHQEEAAMEFVCKKQSTLYDTERSKRLFSKKLKTTKANTPGHDSTMFNRLISDEEFFGKKRSSDGIWYLYEVDYTTDNEDFYAYRDVELMHKLGFLCAAKLPLENPVEFKVFTNWHPITMQPRFVRQLTLTTEQRGKTIKFHHDVLRRAFPGTTSHLEERMGLAKADADPFLVIIPITLCDIGWGLIDSVLKGQNASESGSIIPGSVVHTQHFKRTYRVTSLKTNVYPSSIMKDDLTFTQYFWDKYQIKLERLDEELVEALPCSTVFAVRLNQQALKKGSAKPTKVYLPIELCNVEFFTFGMYSQMSCLLLLFYRIKQLFCMDDLRQQLLEGITNIQNVAPTPSPPPPASTSVLDSEMKSINSSATVTDLEEYEPEMDITGMRLISLNEEDSRGNNSAITELSKAFNPLSITSSSGSDSDENRTNSNRDSSNFLVAYRSDKHKFHPNENSSELLELFNSSFDQELGLNRTTIDRIIDLIEKAARRHANAHCKKGQTNPFNSSMPKKEFVTYDTTIHEDEVLNFDHWIIRKNGTDDRAPFIDIHVLQEAFTPCAAFDEINLERLEIIGDTFLKFVVCNYLFQLCRGLDEGKMALLKDRIVSNLNLFNCATKRNLERYIFAIKIDMFQNYLPEGIELDSNAEDTFRKKYIQQQIRPKTVSDCVESLIGACLLNNGMLTTLFLMKWIGLFVDLEECPIAQDTTLETWFPHFNPILNDRVSIESSQKLVDRMFAKGCFALLESHIGYKFSEKALLVKAFTHQGYHMNTVTGSYETLEFLGDSIIDYLVTRYLYECTSSGRAYTPGEITRIRSALVNNFYFGCLAARHRLYTFFLVDDYRLTSDVYSFVQYCEQRYRTGKVIIGDFIVLDELEDVDLAEVKAPKVMGDLFESMIGAIYLDCNRDLNVVWKVVYPIMRTELVHFSQHKPVNFITCVTELEPDAKFEKVSSKQANRTVVELKVYQKVYKGVGSNRNSAKMNAAKMYVKEYIEKRKNNQPITVAIS